MKYKYILHGFKIYKISHTQKFAIDQTYNILRMNAKFRKIKKLDFESLEWEC